MSTIPLTPPFTRLALIYQTEDFDGWLTHKHYPDSPKGLELATEDHALFSHRHPKAQYTLVRVRGVEVLL